MMVGKKQEPKNQPHSQGIIKNLSYQTKLYFSILNKISIPAIIRLLFDSSLVYNVFCD